MSECSDASSFDLSAESMSYCGLVDSMCSNGAIDHWYVCMYVCMYDPGSILGAIFPCSGAADSTRSESRDGYSSTKKIPAVKSS